MLESRFSWLNKCEALGRNGIVVIDPSDRAPDCGEDDDQEEQDCAGSLGQQLYFPQGRKVKSTPSVRLP